MGRNVTGDGTAEEVLRRAEELKDLRAKGGLLDAGRFVDPAHWDRPGLTATRFHIEFHEQTAGTLSFLIGHPEAEPPPILAFLAKIDLERRFEPIDLRTARYVAIVHLIRYLASRVLARMLVGEDVAELEPRCTEAFGALWALPEMERSEYREEWEAYDVALQLAFGRYERIVRERAGHGPEVERREPSNRTVIRECVLLSRSALGQRDPQAERAGRSLVALLRSNYWVWLVKSERYAQIDAIRLVLVSYLYARITTGQLPDRRELYASIDPRAVVRELKALQRA